MKKQSLIGLAVLGLLSSPLAHAFSDGSMTGMVDGGCEACHAGTGSTNTSVSGPASITLGGSGTYTVRVTSSAAGVTHYGLDFGIFQGNTTTLATGPINLGGGLQNNAGEITHTMPIPLANSATFTWFPDTAGTYSIRGMGNAVIVDMDPGNDVAGLSSPRPFTVVVSAPTTTTTTTAATTTVITAPPTTTYHQDCFCMCYSQTTNHSFYVEVGSCPSGYTTTPPTSTTSTTTTTITTSTTTASTSPTTTIEPSYSFWCYNPTTGDVYHADGLAYMYCASGYIRSDTPPTTTTLKTDKYTRPANLPAAAMYCGFCHGLTIGKWRIAEAPYAGAPTRHKPGGMSKDKWKRVINKMIKKEGCPVPTEEVSNLARYYSSLKR